MLTARPKQKRLIKKAPSIKKCVVCGVEFLGHPNSKACESHRTDRNRKWARDWWAKNRSPRRPTTCEKCGADIEVKSERKITGRFVRNCRGCRRKTRKEWFASQIDDPVFQIKRRLTGAKCSARQRGIEFTLTLNHVLDIYRSQNGLCAISGRRMKLRRGSGDGRRSPDSLSIDRIDSSVGYIDGNIRLVVWAVNMALADRGDVELKSLCLDIVRHQELEGFDYGC